MDLASKHASKHIRPLISCFLSSVIGLSRFKNIYDVDKKKKKFAHMCGRLPCAKHMCFSSFFYFLVVVLDLFYGHKIMSKLQNYKNQILLYFLGNRVKIQSLCGPNLSSQIFYILYTYSISGHKSLEWVWQHATPTNQKQHRMLKTHTEVLGLNQIWPGILRGICVYINWRRRKNCTGIINYFKEYMLAEETYCHIW